MNAGSSALNDVGGAKGRKVFQPKAGALGLRMSELPWLHALRKLCIVSYELLPVAVHHRVLDADVRYWGIPHVREQLCTIAKLAPHLIERFAGRRLMQPSHAAIAKAGAGRMCHDQKVPAIVQDFADVALNMAVAVVLRRQQIAGPCIMAFLQKRIADDS